MKRFFAVLIAFVLMTIAAQAQTARIWFDPDRIAELQIGLLCDVEITGSEAAPDTIVGKIQHIGGNLEFAWRGHKVPLLAGLTFGIKSRSVEAFGTQEIEIKTIHPPFGPNKTSVERWVSQINASALSVRAYTFEYPYEMVPGLWVFEAYAQDNLLYRVEFDVVMPTEAPIQASVCNGNALMS